MTTKNNTQSLLLQLCAESFSLQVLNAPVLMTLQLNAHEDSALQMLHDFDWSRSPLKT